MTLLSGHCKVLFLHTIPHLLLTFVLTLWKDGCVKRDMTRRKGSVGEMWNRGYKSHLSGRVDGYSPEFSAMLLWNPCTSPGRKI